MFKVRGRMEDGKPCCLMEDSRKMNIFKLVDLLKYECHVVLSIICFKIDFMLFR